MVISAYVNRLAAAAVVDAVAAGIASLATDETRATGYVSLLYSFRSFLAKSRVRLQIEDDSTTAHAETWFLGRVGRRVLVSLVMRVQSERRRQGAERGSDR